jgi:asparagine synthase (glutamine-hydrolysing)
MYHFVALLWDAEDLQARAEARHLDQKLRSAALSWESQLCIDGMSVFVLPPSDPGLRTYVLPDEAGVVLGRLFRADLSNPHLARDGHVDTVVTREIVKTAGRHLVQNFWGGYVGLLRNRETRRSYAIRDCSGKLPCYYTRFRDVTILFADVADLAPLELPPFNLNREYLAAFIYSSQLQVRACAFKEVDELLAGDCLEVRGSSVHQTSIWDPRDVYRRRRVDRYEDAVAELREVAQKCIDAWAQTYDPILHSLSGGFDSAVVLGCLSRSPAHSNVTCLNQFTAASYDDERSYARLAAARAGTTLLEVPMQGAAGFDSRLLTGPKTLKPAVPALARVLEIEVINRVAATTGARVLWTGQGGDHIFLQTAGSSSAGDYLATRGPRLGLISAVRDAAHLSRQPYWFVLKSAFTSNHGGWPRPDKLTRAPYFVAPAALPANADDYVSHPWAIGVKDLPSGKLLQIRFLAEVINRHRPLPRFERAYQHHPLLSQPLMEVCLQIPTYLLVRGGRERALARDAFADRVPQEIIHRRDKGSIVSHTTDMLRQGEDFVRGVLLDGVLAGAGIINPDELKPYIVDGQPFREDHLLPLLACIAAEVWARTCTHSAVAVAA